MVTAFLFPGQGAQFSGMGKDLFESSSKVRDLFAMASESLEQDMRWLLFEAPSEVLNQTANAQAGMALAGLAAREILAERGITSQLCAGFSLGEFPALVDAGVLSTEEMFRVITKRGLLTQRVSEKLNATVGECGMAAVLGLSPDCVTSLLSQMKIPSLYPANFNSPSQVTLAGTKKALEAAVTPLKEAGAMRVVPLKVTGPFHCPLLKEASEEFGSWLQQIPFNDPTKEIFSNVTGKPIERGRQARELCQMQLISPVEWVTIQRALGERGIDRLLEAGPGLTLTGLWKKSNISKKISCSPAGALEKIEAL